jgi:hypothetical protein
VRGLRTDVTGLTTLVLDESRIEDFGNRKGGLSEGYFNSHGFRDAGWLALNVWSGL